MNLPTEMPDSFRAGLAAALSRPLLLDPQAFEPLRSAGGLRPRADAGSGSPAAPEPFRRHGDVAVVSVEGPLSQRAWSCWAFEGDGYDAIQQRVAAALDDRATRAVVLRIDSPGGEVAGCFDAVRSLRAASKRAGKPMVAYADELACSAAYALACACDEVVSPDTGLVGSVGVILSVTTSVDALAQRGMKVHLITSGAAKADGHPAVALGDEARARLQADIDQLAGIFAAEVAAARPLDAAEVLALDARTFLGSAAQRAGLVDHVGPFADAVARARRMAGERRPQNAPTGARSANTRTNTMNEKQIAALTAATGETDPDKIVAAVTSMKATYAAHARIATAVAEATGKVAADEMVGAVAALAVKAAGHDAAVARAEKAEQASREAELEQVIREGQAAGKLTPAQCAKAEEDRPAGWARRQSAESLRAFLADAPRVVPAGEHQPPSDGPSPDAQLPADIAALAAKGWANLSDAEKHRLYSANRPLALRLKAAAPKPSTTAGA